MRWTDRVYGEVAIDDPDLLPLIAGPTFQRLKGIRQAGPSAFAHPFKTVSRFEHSLGVYLLLKRLGAGRQECVAGLLHDISHTAFSHAVDFLFTSEEQDHHEGLKPLFLNRSDVRAALDRLGYRPEQFYDDTMYPLLEQPLPALCADRVDYFLRDGISCGVTTPASIAQTLEHLVVADGRICLDDLDAAQDAVDRFAEMNRRWWAGPIEGYIYNEFADALREAIDRGALRKEDLLADDEHVLACLRSARSDSIDRRLHAITHLVPAQIEAFVPRISPKTRWLDPPVVQSGVVRPLSVWRHEAATVPPASH